MDGTPGYTPLVTPSPTPLQEAGSAVSSGVKTASGAVGSTLPYLNPSQDIAKLGVNYLSKLGGAIGGAWNWANTPETTQSTGTVGQQLLPGATLFKPSITPTLGAKFTPPATGNITAPAVHTSQPAEDNIEDMTNTVGQAQNDIATSTVAQNPPAVPPTTPPSTGSTPSASSSTPAGATDLGGTINEILGTLGASEGETAQPSDEQNAELSSAESALAGDESLQGPVGISVANLQSVIDAGNALQSIQTGSVPLTPGEQTQMNDATSQYAGALKAAMTYAQNLQGGTTAAEGGMESFSPALAMANIHSAIDTGQAKISDINAKITASLNKVANAIVNGDYKDANTLYSNISKDITTRVNEIDKMNTAIQNETKQMHADALNQAKLQISSLTNDAKFDQTAYYKAQSLILSNTKLTDAERKTAFSELQASNGLRTAGERQNAALGQFSLAFQAGATMADGTPTVDEHGFITPVAFKAAVQDAPTEGVNRATFIKQFGSQLDPQNLKAYGLTPAEIKTITGALPSS